ncbi:MAG: DUF309 domain-containing protein [Acidimicrobiia bacterium]
MKVQVQLNATLRELLPHGKAEIELAESATVNDLLDHLKLDEEMRELVTVNGEQAEDYSAPLSDGDAVSIFPPVAGGAPSAYLDEGIRLFDRGEYFLSHETLEEHWIEAPEEDRDFYQGLIHLAVGFHHLERGNTKGAKLQFGKASKRLSNYPETYDGVDIASIKSFLEEAPRKIDASEKVEPPELSR